jgi:predicted nuclease with TOPRIM domain
MTEQGPDPGERIEHSADQLEEDLHRLEGRLDDAKDRLKERQEDAEGSGEAEKVAGDWEDTAPDRPLGDDAEGAG